MEVGTIASPNEGRRKLYEQLNPRQITTIHTSHIVNEGIQLYIFGALLLLWLLPQIRRYKSKNLNAGCWYGWDGLGFALVAYLCQSQRWAMACIFTTFFLTWTRLPGSPLDDLHLPSFSSFLEACRRRADASASTQSANISQPLDCIVCWSSESPPLALPCSHRMCDNCLTAMEERQQPYCPLCRLLLFRANTSLQVIAHKAVVATFAARLTDEAICLLLQLCHGEYWDVMKSSATYLLQFYCIWILYGVASTHGISWWRGGVFWYLLPLPLTRLHSGLCKSAGPAAVFALLFSLNIFRALGDIARLDKVVQRVVHDPPFTELYRQ